MTGKEEIDFYVDWLNNKKGDLKSVLSSMEEDGWTDGTFDLVSDRGGRTTRVKGGAKKGEYLIEGADRAWYPIGKIYVAAMYLEQLRREVDIVPNNTRLVEIEDKDLKARQEVDLND
jgi:hypothetical protein